MKTVHVLVLLGAACSAGAQVIITSIAGGGNVIDTNGVNNVPGTSVKLFNPVNLAMDAQRNLYFTDIGLILRLSPGGVITTIAGGGNSSALGDGGPATAVQLGNNLGGMVFDGAGNLFFTDRQRVRRVSRDGILSTIAGTDAFGFSGDGGAALSAQLFNPRGLAFDGSGNLFIADTGNNRVRKVKPDGSISTFAGNGETSFPKDGAQALQTGLASPTSLIFRNGLLYILWNNAGVSAVAANGTISTVIDALQAGLMNDFAFDPQGAIYIVDLHRNQVYRRNSDGSTFTPAAGTGSLPGAFGGDGGPPASALLYQPSAILIEPSGALYISDTSNFRIRLVGTLPSVMPGGVVSASAFGQFTSMAPGSWIEIYGLNLAGDTRFWSGSDFTGVTAPTSLGGTSVTIGGQHAFIDYIGTSQVNAQVPSTIGTGPQPLIVTTEVGASAAYTVTIHAVQPGLLAPSSFNIHGTQYAAALFSDGSTYVLPPGTIAGVNSRRVQPGDTITLYGIGFGSVVPDIPAGQVVQQSNALALPLQFFFGEMEAAVSYKGLAPGLVGLYQFNVVVPNVPSSDAVPLKFTLAGTSGTQTLYLPVQ